MNEPICINQVYMNIEDCSLKYNDLDIPTHRHQVIREHLEVVTLTQSYVNLHTTKDGGRFRFVFHRKNNITAIGVTRKVIKGLRYQVTAQEGHDVAVQWIT